MAFWIASGAGLVGAYFLGSIPTAYLVGRLFYDIDIRDHGSRSVGATNVLRVLGKWPALVVLVVDVLKGLGAIFFVRGLCSLSLARPSTAPSPTLEPQAWMPWAISLAGLAALLGHSRSIWLRFSGGKSVATGLGVVLALSWPVALGALAAFAVVVALCRIVSLGSMAAAGVAIALMICLGEPSPYQVLIVAGGVYVVARHRANIVRLLAGTEPRIGRSLGR